MTIKAKIIALVLAFGLVASAITALGLKTMRDYEFVMRDYDRASENAFRGERLNRLLIASVADVRSLFMDAYGPNRAEYDRRFKVSLNTFEAYLEAWRNDSSARDLPELTQVIAASRPLIEGWRETAALSQAEASDPRKGMRQIDQDNLYQQRLALQAKIDTMVARISTDMKSTRAALQTYQENRVRDFVMIAAAGTLALLAASLWVAISAIANPLNRVRQSIIRISEGAYDTLVPATGSKDEISEIWGALAILKDRAQEGERLTREKLEAEQSLRELVLD